MADKYCIGCKEVFKTAQDIIKVDIPKTKTQGKIVYFCKDCAGRFRAFQRLLNG